MPTDDSARAPRAHEQLDVDGVAMVRLLGPQDRLLTTLEKQYPLVDVHVRGNQITLEGDPAQVAAAKRLIDELLVMVRGGQELGEVEVASSARIIDQGQGSPAEVLSQAILTSRGKSIRPKTLGQKAYVDAIDHHTIVFGIGPAGTGKTYLAMAKAVQALQRKEVDRIILTRPAVEAGERLGFLPGTLTDKIDPYLRPLYDALDDMIPADKLGYYMSTRVIEIAPLAYMRGRTLDHAYIILDEAQNATDLQLKMFLTRIGANAKAIITGDLSQVDLPKNQRSGLDKAIRILRNIDGIGHVELDEEDVVRHRLVKAIIRAYDKEHNKDNPHA